jgi:hypothetical protein
MVAMPLKGKQKLVFTSLVPADMGISAPLQERFFRMNQQRHAEEQDRGSERMS